MVPIRSTSVKIIQTFVMARLSRVRSERSRSVHSVQSVHSIPIIDSASLSLSLALYPSLPFVLVLHVSHSLLRQVSEPLASELRDYPNV